MDRRPAASLRVECLGLPGAGKSRLCAAAGEALAELGLETRLHLRRRRGMGHRLLTATRVAALLARRPLWCRRTLARLRAAEPEDGGRLAWIWLKRSAAALRHTRQPAVHLSDSGIAQALWSLGFRGRAAAPDEALADLASEAILPDLLLLLECRREILVRRLAARPASAGLPGRLARDPEALDRGIELIERLAAILAAPTSGRAGPRLVRLASDDERDLARNVDRLLSLLETAAS